MKAPASGEEINENCSTQGQCCRVGDWIHHNQTFRISSTVCLVVWGCTLSCKARSQTTFLNFCMVRFSLFKRFTISIRFNCSFSFKKLNKQNPFLVPENVSHCFSDRRCLVELWFRIFWKLPLHWLLLWLNVCTRLSTFHLPSQYGKKLISFTFRWLQKFFSRFHMLPIMSICQHFRHPSGSYLSPNVCDKLCMKFL